MLVLPETRLSIRQAFVTGQLTEKITGRAFDNFDISMRWSHTGGSGLLPLTLQKKPGGFFTLQFAPGRTMPVFSGQTDVALTITISIQDRAPFDMTKTVPIADLTLTEAASSIGGTPVTYGRINGAPFDFSAQLAPGAVALKGIILRDHDPADPVSNVTVTTTPPASGGPVVSATDGIFFIPVLPVDEAITLNLDEGQPIIPVPFRPDYARPVNTLTLSLATPSP